MAKSATGVMDKPAKTTKATKTTKSTTATKKKTQSTTRRRGSATAKTAPVKPAPEKESASAQATAKEEALKPTPEAEQAPVLNAANETEASPETASSPETRTKTLASRGEEAAARFLYRRGYEILNRNWKCFAGEVDIVAKDDETLVFVEVKTRKDTDRGFPSEAVPAEKRARYEKIALAYLSECETADFPVRFDTVSIIVVAPDKAMIRHQINAFSVA